MTKFINVKADGYDIIINTSTISYIERDPQYPYEKTRIWVSWAASGYVTANGSIESIEEKLK